ncbi:MAG: hypothetical protein PUB13_09200 [Lachnospiraceae bacterium]|nr:hypothetical protein [Lachnospiraceae bacterium]
MKVQASRFFRKKADCFVFAGLWILFGYFFLFREVKELGDSFQYLNQMISREPVYALLLQILTKLFGEHYTIPLSFLQNILAIISTYWLYYRITELFSFNPVFETGCAIILVSPHLITPFAAKSGMIITNSVLTEGIALSLYYIWAGMLLTLLLDRYEKKKGKRIITIMLLSVFLSMIRGQLMICIIVWMIVTGWCMIRDGKYKQILLVVVATALCFVGKTQLTKCYNYLESGLYVNTVSSKPMILSNLLYLSDTEDGKQIEDERLRKAYENMVSEVEKQGLSVKNAKGNLLQRAQFHESGHETINFDIIVPNLNQYISYKYGITESDYQRLLIKQDEYAGEIFQAVIGKNIPAFLKNYFVIASLGFVRSVAIDRAFLPYFAVAVYLLVVILILLLLMKNHRSPSAWFMLFVLLLICGTVFGTSIMIECISRYMIYNLPLFYIAGMTMLVEFGDSRKMKGKKENGI